MRTLIFFLAILLIAACNKIDHTPAYYTRQCKTPPLKPFFPVQYYSLDDLDTIIISKFNDDSTFSELMSSSTYGIDDLFFRTAEGFLPDGYLIKDMDIDMALQYGYAYEINIPSIQQTYRIWDMPLSDSIDTYDGNSNNGHAGECYDYSYPGNVSGGKYKTTTWGPYYSAPGGLVLELDGQ